MKIKLNIQKNGENLIKDKLLKESEAKPKKAYFFMGDIKESGFDILEECLIDLKARKLIVIGVNKKNTTKKMLDTLYSYTKSVYLFNNNGMVEFDSNIVVFEYTDRAIVYVMNAHVSEGALVDNIATYTTIEYDLNEKEDATSYKEYIDNLVSISKLDDAIKLEKDVIKTLFDEGQIFTPKQYTHSVMTIAELLGDKKVESKEENIKDDDIEVNDEINTDKAKIPTVDLSDIEDFSIDIDIADSVKREEDIALEVEELKSEKDDKKEAKEVKKKAKKEEVMPEEVYDMSSDEAEEVDFDANSVLDIESLLFEKSDIELDKKSIDKKISTEKGNEEEGKSISKKVDLTKVSNLIMELPKKPTKGKDVSVIKIPNYIKEMIPDFFAATANFKSVEKADGTYKETNIKLEIINIITNEKYSDASALLSQKNAQTYMTFSSEHFKDINYDENDIVRIIKLSDDTYHMEIVSKDVQEYRIWKKLCTKNFKGSSRSYGVM